MGTRRSPPAVAWTVCRSTVWAGFGCAVSAVAAACAAAWAAGHGWIPGASVPVAALAGVALSRLTARPTGTLRWDGAAWWWHAPGQPEQPAQAPMVAIDGGSRLLLRLRLAHGAVRWLAVAEASDPARWHGLRVALFAGRAPQPAAPGALAG